MVHVRRAEVEDVRDAAEVYLRSRHSAVPAVPPLVHDDDDVRDWLAKKVFADQELWVADDDEGAVVGLMVLAGDRLEHLYVDPAHSGEGVGSALLGVAKSVRPRGLQLWTFESNLDARGFYERHGFVAAERTDGTRNEEQAPDIRYVWSPP
jgi:GNAT superfamily N-acetyltransferase